MNHGNMVIFNQYTTFNFGHQNFVVNIDLAFGSVYINNKIPLTSVSGSILVEYT